MTIQFAIALPFLMAALIPLIYKRFTKVHIGWLVFLVPTILFAFFLRLIPQVSKGDVYSYTLNWIPAFNMNFTTYLDGLSMIFVLLITGVGSLVILYSIFYLSAKESLHHFYCYLLLFMGAMLGVVLSDNLMVLYVFWELTSVSSFLLIAFWHHRQASRDGAKKAMLITVAGGLAMLVGFVMLYVLTGTMSIHEIIAIVPKITNEPLFISAMLLILIGAFTKSAQFPFHIWLPDAMEAPTPVSAYLHSATMVKAGIYLVARMSPIFAGEMLWFWIISAGGLLTLFWGSFNAVKQTDLKALLAFSTISQLGLIMSLLGLGSVAVALGNDVENVIYTQATFAALFHLINHSTFKGALFMAVGIIDHEVGTRDIRRLGGLMSLLPITFTITVIGALSMAGMPLFNGFLSKEMFFEAVLHIQHADIFSLHTWGLLFPIIAWVASVFTFIYSLIIIFKAFLGNKEKLPKERKIHEAPIGMLMSPIILVTLVVGIFFFPNIIGKYLLKPAMLSIFPNYAPMDELTVKIYAWHGVNGALLMTIGVVVVGGLLYWTLPKWKKIYQFFPKHWTFNNLFQRLLQEGDNVASFTTNLYMTGSLRHYFMYLYMFFIVVIGGYFIWSGAFAFDPTNDSEIEWFEFILVFVMLISAFAIVIAKSRLTAVMLNGVLGFGVSIYFVILRAPDLALTQLVIESVTTVLFLLSFSHLPDWKAEKATKSKKSLNAIISVLVGLIVVAVSFSVLNYKEFKTISAYFENAYELAGGANIVNTILGDFRAFDTMLEVVVLMIAGIGVYTLVKVRSKKEREKS